jgi:hypothetical protein
MIAREKLSVAIGVIRESVDATASRAVQGLCDVMINELREANDTEAAEFIRFNQGGIAVLKMLKDYVNK